MTWAVVARKDFTDARRSRTMLALVGLFLLFMAASAYLVARVLTGFGDVPGYIFYSYLLSPASFLVPIIAIFLGYRSIAGERESGSVKFLLALPHSRRDVLLGKLLGRTGVLSVAIVAGFTLSAVIVIAPFEDVSLVNYAGITVATLLLGVTYVAIAVGASAATATAGRAAALAIGIYAVFEMLWEVLLLLAVYVLNGFSIPWQERFPEWFHAMATLSPTNAYYGTSMWVIGEDLGNEFTVPPMAAEPFYLQGWFGVAVLLAWIGVAVGVGYWRFRDVDL